MIPLVDLKRQYEASKSDIDSAIKRVIESSEFIMGKEVRMFENEFADYIGADYCIATSSGTSALILSLLALGIKPGDEVITTTLSFAATAEAIAVLGAQPIFADIDERTYNIDVNHVSKLITGRTRAIIPVHLYGLSCEMMPLMKLAKERKIFVIEDSSQAHGAMYHDKKVGVIGDIGCFSFYPSKNLGAYGDAGAIVTNNPDIASRISLLRDHGRRDKYIHEIVGVNARMDAIQAAILRVKLPHLTNWNERRAEIASSYQQLLNVGNIILPFVPVYSRHVYHLFVVRLHDRDRIRNLLLQKGILTGVHYPVPLHMQPAFKPTTNSLMVPLEISESVASTILSIPIFPELTFPEVQFIADAILESIQ